MTKLSETLCVMLGGLSLMAPIAVQALQDPTRPLDAVAAVDTRHSGGLRLDSVLISEQRRLAVINGQTLRENDVIGEGRVLRILPGLVEIRQADKTLRLQMHSEIRKEKDNR